jgi:hypothetical protein
MILLLKKMPKNITKLTFNTGQDPQLNGDEVFPIIGGQISAAGMRKVIGQFKGLGRYWDCMEKAKIVRNYLCSTRGDDSYIIMIGSLHIIASDYNSSYGYNYNPPYEIHAWVFHPDTGGVYDFALPGVIEKGQTLSDRYGSYIDKGRVPSIAAFLLECCPDWLRYDPREVYNEC